MEVKLKLQESWFNASNSRGATIKMGGGLADGPSPMEAVLMAAGACSGVDVVSILEKMHQPLEDMDIIVSGERREEHPRYYENILLKFVLKGDLDPGKVRRAIELSLEKYCSVVNGLTPKAKVAYEFVIEEGRGNN